MPRGPWRERLITYLQDNRDYLAGRIEEMSGVTMNEVEATYLAWLDVRTLALEDPGGYFEGFGVGFSDGRQFDGEGHVRMNFGCPRSMLVEACDRLARGVEQISRG